MIEVDGLWQRPEADDALIIREVASVYADLPIRPGDVVLDLGAHIGATSRLVLAKGAAKVIAVEADPSSVRVLRRNVEGRPAEVIWAAVGPNATLYARPERPYLSTTLAGDRGRLGTKVPTVSLGLLLARYHPTVVKCDIEFAEFELPELTDLPAHVRVLALEVHIRHDFIFRHRRQTARELRIQRERAVGLIRAVEAQGFRAIRREDKQRGGMVAQPDRTGLPPLTVSVDGIWTR